jgi:hypothetical protein
LDKLSHARVDLSTKSMRVELWYGQRGQTNNLGWIVTFMGDANQVVA